MWIAERMHVAHGSVDCSRGLLKNTATFGGIQISRIAGKDLGVPRILQKRRQPSHLELKTHND